MAKMVAGILLVSLFIGLYLKNHNKNALNYNVILISIDTLGARHMGIYGYDRDTTPNIDQFAKKALLFKNHFAEAFDTLPSHLSMFTGIYPFNHKVVLIEDPPLDLKFKTFPEILKTNGYKTGWFARKFDRLVLELGFGRGFDDIYRTSIDDEKSVNHVNKWISDNSNQKFFLFLHSDRAHDPYIVKKPFSQMFDPDYRGKVIGDEDYFVKKYIKDKPDFDITSDWRMARDLFWSNVDKKNSRDIRKLISLYDGEIRFIDELIGSLFNHLKKIGLWDKTIIVLTSDHGEAFGEHNVFTHRTLHDEVLNVPLIIHIPGLGSEVITSDSQGVDILPTVIDALGLENPSSFDGKSLLPLIKNPDAVIHDYTYAYSRMGEQSFLRVAVRDKHWKAMLNEQSVFELYDRTSDRFEKFNKADELPEVRRSYERLINKIKLTGRR